MSDSLYEKIQADARYLNLDICAQEVAQLAINDSLSDDDIRAVFKGEENGNHRKYTAEAESVAPEGAKDI